MGGRRLWWTVLALGVVLVLLSALADQIGIGNGGFGWKQVIGIVVGAIAAALGVVRLFFSHSGASEQSGIGAEKTS